MARGSKRALAPEEELANAIVRQAASDYRMAYRASYRNAMRHGTWLSRLTYGDIDVMDFYDVNSDYSRYMPEVERFFRSQWAVELTNADPVLILKNLEEERAEYLTTLLKKVQQEEAGRQAD